MRRWAGADAAQANLFGWDPNPVAAPPRSRPRKAAPEAEPEVETKAQPEPGLPPPAPEPVPSEPESATAFAERAAQADLDELVAALSDEALAYLALASARQLKRWIARTGGTRPGKALGRPSALNRADQDLAREWARQTDPDESW